MSWEKDRVRDEISYWVEDYVRRDETSSLKFADKILSIPELAVVDRGAKLPENRFLASHPFVKYLGKPSREMAYQLGQVNKEQQMVEAGWVREMPEEAER